MHTLVMVAHPALHRSRINSHLVEVARHIDQVQIMDLYDRYPDFEIDVAREQELLVAADHIVLQHPMYWYSTPALLKEWIDLVFQHGFAYGTEHKALAGKTLVQAISAGGDPEAYGADGFNRFSIEELIRPMEATAFFCDMRWQSPFVTHGGHIITDEEIHAAGHRYKVWLTSLTHSTQQGDV